MPTIKILPNADCQLPILQTCPWFLLRLTFFLRYQPHRSRWFLVTRLAIVDVVDAANRRCCVTSAEAGILDQRQHRDLGFVSRSVTDKPRVVLVLACVFAQSNHLRRARLAGDIESGHLNARAS